MLRAQAKLSHSPHFIELELIGRVGRFPPVVSWIEAVEDRVWGEQVAGRRIGETYQHGLGSLFSWGSHQQAPSPEKGTTSWLSRLEWLFPFLQKELSLLPGCEDRNHRAAAPRLLRRLLAPVH